MIIKQSKSKRELRVEGSVLRKIKVRNLEMKNKKVGSVVAMFVLMLLFTLAHSTIENDQVIQFPSQQNEEVARNYNFYSRKMSKFSGWMASCGGTCDTDAQCTSGCRCQELYVSGVYIGSLCVGWI